MGVNPRCHKQVLAAAKAVVQTKGLNEFTLSEVIDCMRRMGSRCTKATITNLVASRCCINGPGPRHGAKQYGCEVRATTGRAY